MSRDRTDGHGAVAVVPGFRGVGVGVGVNPDHGQVVAVACGQFGEGDDADRALAAEREDAVMGVPGDGLLSGLGAARTADRDSTPLVGPSSGSPPSTGTTSVRPLCSGREGVQHPGADGVSAPGLVHRHTGQQLGDCGGTGALPLRPDETEGGGIGGDV